VSLLWFVIATALYFFVKINSTTTLEKSMYLGVYLLLLIVGQFFINLNLTETMCGTRQWQSAVNVTAIPWLFIFGVLNMFLYLFPSWLSPFSNTFGYGLVRLMGLHDFLDEILKNPMTENEQIDESTKLLAQTLDHIYSDRSMLINEITNVETFWEKMKNIFKAGVYESKTSPDVKLNKFAMLKYYVDIKNYVAEFIWYMLSGALVTSVSYNYLVNMSCSRSVSLMTQKQKEFQQQQQADLKKQQAEKLNDRVYTISD
jgi:hypothetical protein